VAATGTSTGTPGGPSSGSCWTWWRGPTGLVEAGPWRGDLDGLRAALGDGTLRLAPPPGILIVGDRATWLATRPRAGVEAGAFADEVADEIERLNGRPDSGERCRQAVDDYLADPTEPNRLAVRDRYLAVPPHRRDVVLGDMDRKDGPIRMLITDLGLPWGPSGDGVATEETRAAAPAYFRRMRRARRAAAAVPADGPEWPAALPLLVPHSVFPSGLPDPPGTEALQNDYPAPITVGGRTYPAVSHAYWRSRPPIPAPTTGSPPPPGPGRPPSWPPGPLAGRAGGTRGRP
jgi:hypothetical protein